MIDPRNPLGLDPEALADVERECKRLQEQEWQRQDEAHLARSQIAYLVAWLKEHEQDFRGK